MARADCPEPVFVGPVEKAPPEVPPVPDEGDAGSVDGDPS